MLRSSLTVFLDSIVTSGYSDVLDDHVMTACYNALTSKGIYEKVSYCSSTDLFLVILFYTFMKNLIIVSESLGQL